MQHRSDDDPFTTSQERLTSRRAHLGVLAGGALLGVLGGGSAAEAGNAHGGNWPTSSPSAAGFNAGALAQAVRYAGSKGGSGFVVRHGRQVASWGNVHQPYQIYSATKFLGSLLLMQAMAEGRVNLSTPCVRYLSEFGVPPVSNKRNSWAAQVTLTHLAAHIGGFDEPGGFNRLLFRPGSYHFYSNGGANWAADVLTARFNADLASVMRSHILSPIGVPAHEFGWRANAYRGNNLHGHARREFASGVFISASAFARIGLLCLRKGNWNGRQILNPSILAKAVRPNPALLHIKDFRNEEPRPCSRYWMFISNNADGSMANIPHDAYMAYGKYNNHCLVVPSRDLVVVRLGRTNFGDNRPAINHLFKGFVGAIRH